jgi:hypothetical protein
MKQPAQAYTIVSATRGGRSAQIEAGSLRKLPGRLAQTLVEGSILCSHARAETQFARNLKSNVARTLAECSRKQSQKVTESPPKH